MTQETIPNSAQSTTHHNKAKTNDWRRTVFVDMLHGFNNNEYVDSFVASMVVHKPEVLLLKFDANARTFHNFLLQHAADVRTFISGADSFDATGVALRDDFDSDQPDSPVTADEQIAPYAAWYAFTYEGAELETVIVAREYENCITLGNDRAMLQRFVRAFTAYSERPTGRCLRYSQGWKSAPDLDMELGKVTWNDVVLPPEILARIREAMEGFFAHRETLKAMGFAWRRGILLIGPPGTGKTMVCKAVASALPPEMPFLYVRDLRERGEKEAIRSIFERARKLAPYLLAFEDLDGLVSDINRTVFLNEMDGFANNDGILIIASSNHPEKIDTALLARPSRFDRVLHLGLPDGDLRREYCERFLNRGTFAAHLSADLDRTRLAARMAEASEGFTPALLKEAFLSAALKRVLAGAVVLDDTFGETAIEQIAELKDQLRQVRDAAKSKWILRPSTIVEHGRTVRLRGTTVEDRPNRTRPPVRSR